MKKKQTILAMVLALALILGAGFLLSRKSSQAPAAQDSTEDLSISVGGSLTVNGLTFTKAGDAWVYSADPDFPLSQDKLNTMVETLEGLEADRALENPGSLSQYGLDKPLATVTAGPVTLSIGSDNAMNGGRYFSLGNGRVYITRQALLEPFDYDLLGLAKMETAPRMETLSTVTLTRADGSGWTIRNRQGEHLTYSDSIRYFLDTANGPLALDTELAESLIRKATDLEFTGCAAFKPENLAELGLDSPLLTVTVAYSAPEAGVYTLEIGSAVSGKYYARISGSNTVYWMDAVPVNALRDSAPETLLPDEVLLLDMDTVNSVTIRLAQETWQFTPQVVDKQSTEAAEDTQGQTEIRWLLNGTETNLSQVLETLTTMASLGSARALTPTLAQELKFTFETQDAFYPTVTLAFHRYSARASIVTLNGEPTVLVSRSDAAALYEAVTAIVLG